MNAKPSSPAITPLQSLMKFIGASDPMLLVSPMLFALSWFLPGFYTKQTHQPHNSFELLITGWLGIFALHFSWLANPLYLGALIARISSPRNSAILAILAFCMALEFLLHSSILADEGGGTATIMGVGWGYYLWLMSFMTLASSSLAKAKPDIKPWIHILFLGVAMTTTLGFAQHYYLSDENHFSLIQRRDKQFSELCAQSGETFFSAPLAPISGIYVQ